MKYRNGIIFVSLSCLLITGAVLAVIDKGPPWHPSSGIYVRIDGNSVNLQEAVTSNMLRGTHTYASSGGQYHTLENIWVSKNGQEMNLLDMLNSAAVNPLCNPVLGNTVTQYTGPADKTVPYHYATRIEIISDGISLSLQEAIDSGMFNHPDFGTSCGECGQTILCDGTCSNPTNPDYGNSCGSCGGTVLCDGTCSVPTPGNYGEVCPETACSYAGTVECDGTCSSTPKARGTSCASDGTKTCDGSGNCLGWSGNGCTTCPNGVLSDSPASCTIYACNKDGTFGALQGRSKPNSWLPWGNYAPWCELRCGSDTTLYDWQQKPV